MASKSPLKSLPVRGRASGALEGVPSKIWRRNERIAQALRSLGDWDCGSAFTEQRFTATVHVWPGLTRPRPLPVALVDGSHLPLAYLPSKSKP